MEPKKNTVTYRLKNYKSNQATGPRETSKIIKYNQTRTHTHTQRRREKRLSHRRRHRRCLQTHLGENIVRALNMFAY